MVVPRDLGEKGMESYYLKETEFVLQDERSFGDCLHNNVNIFNPTEL